MATTFLTAVNDILTQDGILAGDDDDITSFSSQQHVASIRKARLAVRNELADLMVDELFPYERASTTITTVAGTRTYATPTGFTRFEDERPWLIEVESTGESKSTLITEFPGGEDRLRKFDLRWEENESRPYHWYYAGGSNKAIGLYPVPDKVYYWRYYYEKEVTVSTESDLLPFLSETETLLFIRLCTRHFKYMRMSPEVREQIFPGGLELDAERATLRAKLFKAVQHKQPTKHYGRSYRSTFDHYYWPYGSRRVRK